MEVWIQVAQLALKYGFPAVQNVIATWAEDMTEAEIRAKIEEYQSRLKKPEDYFN